MAGILCLTPTISSSDIFTDYCHVYYDGMKWKKGKKYFGDWVKHRVVRHGLHVGFLYIPTPIWNHFDCEENKLNLLKNKTKCAKWAIKGYEYFETHCKVKSIY